MTCFFEANILPLCGVFLFSSALFAPLFRYMCVYKTVCICAYMCISLCKIVLYSFHIYACIVALGRSTRTPNLIERFMFFNYGSIGAQGFQSVNSKSKTKDSWPGHTSRTTACRTPGNSPDDPTLSLQKSEWLCSPQQTGQWEDGAFSNVDMSW